MVGSSPRVRGKPAHGHAEGFRVGLIPACAGKTLPPRRAAVKTKAHPRVCGENPGGVLFALAAAGSSPRVRGKLQLAVSSVIRSGLIPACAGKTTCVRQRRWPVRAHPRVCGENVQIVDLAQGESGSSPRVRGKLVRCCGCGLDGGLIPACAGKTLSSRMLKTWAAAHPRVCGENHIVEDWQDYVKGSSPRVRGKHLQLADDSLRRGLIPACAGKTPRSRSGRLTLRAHPRVCGENSPRDAGGLALRGSSPRVRGKRVDHS